MKTDAARRRKTKTSRNAKPNTDKPRHLAGRLHGLGIGTGVAIGPAFVVEPGAVPVPEYAIKAREVGTECKRFNDCVARSRRQIAGLIGKSRSLPSEMRDEVVNLLDAHRQMLKGSRLVRGVEARIKDARINAESAIAAEVSTLVDQFHAMDDPYLAARGQEIHELGNRLLRNLAAFDHPLEADVPAGSVIIAGELTPAEAALLDPDAVAGLVTEIGGAESHTAIMARALELPAVLGVENLRRTVSPGVMIAVDGDSGDVVVNPTAREIAAHRKRQRAFRQDRRRLSRLSDLPRANPR